MTERSAMSMWLVASLFYAMIGALLGEGLTIGVIVSAPLVLLSLSAIRRLDPKDGSGLSFIFILALVLRWTVSCFVHFVIYKSRPGLFAPDEVWYDYAANTFSEYLSGHVPDPYPDAVLGFDLISVMGRIYYVFGNGAMTAKLFQCFLGAWAAVFASLMAGRLFDPAVARRAGILAAVAPSLVLWSSLNIKDTLTLVGAEMALFSFMSLREKVSLLYLALFGVSLLFIASNRAYEVVFVAAGVGASFLFSGSKQPLIQRALISLVLMGLLYAVVKRSGGDQALGTDEQTTMIESISMVRAGYANGTGSAVNIDLVDTSTPLGLATWTPIGLGYFFLAPIPFTGTSAISIATTPEMFVWYYFLPSLFRGLRAALKRNLTRLAPLLAYVVVSSVGWSMVIGNVGSLYRYRAQVLFLPLIFIAADMVRRRDLAVAESQRPLVAVRPVLTLVPRRELSPGQRQQQPQLNR